MNIKDFLLAELDREVERSRRALEQVPEGKSDWKPHEKSMAFGYLANMVATIPMWITMQLTQDELDIAPKDGSKFEMKPLNTSAEYVEALDKAAAGAREAFEKTSDEHLNDQLAIEGRRQCCRGSDAPRDDSGLAASPRASSRTDDCVSASDGREGAGHLRPVSG